MNNEEDNEFMLVFEDNETGKKEKAKRIITKMINDLEKKKEMCDLKDEYGACVKIF
jgi:hypothetical protein